MWKPKIFGRVSGWSNQVTDEYKHLYIWNTLKTKKTTHENQSKITRDKRKNSIRHCAVYMSHWILTIDFVGPFSWTSVGQSLSNKKKGPNCMQNSLWSCSYLTSSLGHSEFHNFFCIWKLLTIPNCRKKVFGI